MQYNGPRQHWKNRFQKTCSHNETTGTNTIEKPNDYWNVIVSVIGLSVGVLSAICYGLGRASLLGWYSAAGVPLLTFSWPIQDVMVRGCLALDKWAILTAIVVIPIVVYAFVLASTHQIRELLTKTSLGRRMLISTFQKNASKTKKPRPPLLQKADFYLGLALPICLLFVIYATVMLLILEAYNEGKERFEKDHALATEKTVTYSAVHNTDILKGRVQDTTLSTGDEYVLKKMGYAYVRVIPRIEPDAAEKNSGYCGWLVQASERQVLLLQDSGITLLNYADHPFRWGPTSPSKCKAST